MVVFVVFVVVSLSILSGDKTSVKPTIVARLSAPILAPRPLRGFTARKHGVVIIIIDVYGNTHYRYTLPQYVCRLSIS